MHYAIADIHGCRDELMMLLDRIRFSDSDTLYVLGDTIDRGPDPAGVLRELSLMPNAVLVLGNHEYMARTILPQLLKPVEEENIEQVLTQDFLRMLETWQRNGCDVTIQAFREMNEEDRAFYLEFLSDEFSLYETVSVEDREFFLSHTLPRDPAVLRGKRGVTVEAFVFGRPDFEDSWEQETRFLCGHTPTFLIKGAEKGKVFRKGNLIDIDCGCYAGMGLAAFCLETEQSTVVSKEG